MMKPTIHTGSAGDAGKLKEALKALAKKQVYVGVPEDSSNRNTDEMTNAGLVYLHTNGSALQGIPARPIIEPAIQEQQNKARIVKALGGAGKAVLAQNSALATEELQRAGILGANAAKRWFTDPQNGWAPNTPATAARKGSERPLIDTAQLRRSITYLVADEK